MLCQNCGSRTATTHIRRIRNGAVQDRYLCRVCATQMGYQMMTETMPQSGGYRPADANATEEVRCSCCGMSFSEILSTGKIGCPECYTLFGNSLASLLHRIHSGTQHTGRVPSVASPKAQKDLRMEELRRNLTKAIEEQNIEQATLLWNELRKLEEKETRE